MDKNSIITLQLGHYSNYVGAHFWNIQEAGFVFDNSVQLDVDHSVLFREGRTQRDEVTFTPRLVSVDLKGALGSLPVFGDLYDDVHQDLDKLESGLSWDGDVQVKKEEGARKNEYLRYLDRQEVGGKRKQDEFPGRYNQS